MDLILSHWHCWLPLIALGIGLMIMNKGDKPDDAEQPARPSAQTHEEE
ncbi:MAG: hypothetical protein LBR29_00515 [Methylobacteriaceae bacterium]|nr:hypothetical protein [Methylobacteriaceae bacterium]